MVAASPSPSAMRAAAWSTSSATPSTDRRPRLSTGTGRCGCKTFLAEWALCGAVVVEPRTGYVEQPPIRSVTLLPPAERKSATQNEVERPVRDWCRDEAEQREPYISRQRQRRTWNEKRLDRLTGEAVRADGPADEAARHEAEALRATWGAEEVIHSPQLLTGDATPEAICDLLTVEELAGKMHCSVSTIWRAVRDEGMPAFRISARCVRLDWTSVSQWLIRKRRVRPASQPTNGSERGAHVAGA